MAVEGKSKASVPAQTIIKNSGLAPLIFFDQAPTYGVFQGNVELELSARILIPRTDGTVQIEVISAGHLRCSVEAAANLRQSLDQALAMAGEQLTLKKAS